MSTVYDNTPVPGPSCEEQNAFAMIHEKFMSEMIQRFGHSRTMVLVDWYCVGVIAEAICNPFEKARSRRILSDLSEELRSEQEQNRAGFDDDGRYWLLVPTKEP